MPDQGGGLLARSGLDSIKIGGHKVPIALLAGVVALVGVIAVLRARKQGQQVATVGSSPATAADSGFGMPLPSSDPGPAIANLSQQINDLSQSLNPPAGTGTPAKVFGTIGSLFGQSGVYTSPGQPGDVFSVAGGGQGLWSKAAGA